ncbi:MAG: hypothetical protein ACRELB_14700, partial [Polyangiaceae bacterium]
MLLGGAAACGASSAGRGDGSEVDAGAGGGGDGGGGDAGGDGSGGPGADGGGVPADGSFPVGDALVSASRFVTGVVSFSPTDCAGFGILSLPVIVEGPPVGGGADKGST